MTAVKAIQNALAGTQGLLKMFVADFSDAELLVRPIPASNHAAWQIGNVIAGDVFFMTSEFPNMVLPALPEGFMEQHGPKGAGSDDAARFLGKDAYLKHLDTIRGAVIAELGKLSDADLDKPTSGAMKSVAPTVGQLFQLASDHTLLHVGQFSVIRRKLGKAVLF